MSDEVSGGVEGLRAWAADAAERVRGLMPGLGSPTAPPGAYDASVAELDHLVRLLDHDPALRSSASVWFGAALTLRHDIGRGASSDADRAQRLLRDARDRGTPLGAAATEEDRRWAALFLLSHVSPLRMQRHFGGAPDFSGFLDWVSGAGPKEMTAVASEIATLTSEVMELPLPAELLGQLSGMQGLLASPPDAAGFPDALMSMMPGGGGPHAEQLRQMMARMFRTGGRATGTSAAGSPAAGASATGTRATGTPDAGKAAKSDKGGEVGKEEPPAPPSTAAPSLTREDIRRLATALDAVHATSWGLDDVLKNGDPHALNELLGRLRAAQDLPLAAPNGASALEALRALLLSISPGVGGSVLDQSAGHAHTDTITGHFERIAQSPPPGVEDPAVFGRAFTLYGRVMQSAETENVEMIEGLVKDAEALERDVPEGHPFRFAVSLALGAAYGRLAMATKDKEMILRCLSHMEAGMDGINSSDLPFAREMSVPFLREFDVFRAGLAGDSASLPHHVPPPPGATADEVYGSALSLGVRFSLTRDPDVLATLIDALERVRDEVRQGRAPRIAADALWHLAEAYQLRRAFGGEKPDAAGEAATAEGTEGEDTTGKDTAALETAKEALTTLAADVLLQSGAEHGLLRARSGASRGVEAALWAASYGRIDEAVAVLELGRALVLQAASTSQTVPERLDALGHHDLAESWRAAGPGTAVADAEGVPGQLPSTLRRQALEALGYRRHGSVFDTPTLSELADGVEESGADALVYLVPGEGKNAGLAIVVGPEIGLGAGPLPFLTGTESDPLERYLDATTADADTAPGGATGGGTAGGGGDPAAGRQAWEDALSELCDWAFQVLSPVLTGIEKRLSAAGRTADRPPRIVLVPCGRLGIVPWHAARFPAEAPHDYLCQAAVISYAASGSQFLRAVKRTPRDPAALPVLLADPGMTLTHAEVEVMALRNAFYGQARICGGVFELPEEELTDGTPDEVLAFLADGASLLHVAAHGSAGTRPTVSALHLAAAEDLLVDEGGAETEGGPEAGWLTVTRLLDRPSAQHASTDGPLVVLSACQTDLSTRDHDEALTLTTAFVSGGARDVVGSRWTTQDSASALLMAVFHHRLTVDGLSPVDALRAAQLWMLDSRREDPGSLGAELLRHIRRPDLDRVPLWAAFIHQGHPGPAARHTERGNA